MWNKYQRVHFCNFLVSNTLNKVQRQSWVSVHNLCSINICIFFSSEVKRDNKGSQQKQVMFLALVVNSSFTWRAWAPFLIPGDRIGLWCKGTTVDGSAEPLLFVGVRKNSNVANSKKAQPAFYRGAALWHSVGGSSTRISWLRVYRSWEYLHWQTCPEIAVEAG